MTLFQKISQIVPLGYNITFSPEILMLVIEIRITTYNEKIYGNKQMLPMSDHFYEKTIVDCINFMIEDIDKLIDNDKTTEKLTKSIPT